MQDLWILCLTRHLNVLYKCMKFRLNTSHGYQVIERTRNRMTHGAVEMYEFSNSFNSVQLAERTKCILLCYKGNNLKNKHGRVMVLVHDTSSECA